MTYLIQQFDAPSELAHHGVKGMRWGVVNEDESAGRPSPKADRAKQVAIGVGVLAVVAGAGYAAYTMKQNGSLPLGKLDSATSASGKSLLDKVLEEPTSVIHAARGKSTGFQFVQKGGLKDAIHEYEAAGFHNVNAGEIFKRYGDATDKIAARILDPDGRKDFAGRAIFHEIIVPRSMSSEVNNIDDVKTKIWPLLKDAYKSVYDANPRR